MSSKVAIEFASLPTSLPRLANSSLDRAINGRKDLRGKKNEFAMQGLPLLEIPAQG
jgi:hypothetical protein